MVRQYAAIDSSLRRKSARMPARSACEQIGRSTSCRLITGSGFASNRCRSCVSRISRQSGDQHRAHSRMVVPSLGDCSST